MLFTIIMYLLEIFFKNMRLISSEVYSNVFIFTFKWCKERIHFAPLLLFNGIEKTEFGVAYQLMFDHGYPCTTMKNYTDTGYMLKTID